MLQFEWQDLNILDVLELFAAGHRIDGRLDPPVTGMEHLTRYLEIIS